MTDAEPPHARTWQAVREKCEREPVEYCGYPWCTCELELTTAQEGLRTQTSE